MIISDLPLYVFGTFALAFLYSMYMFYLANIAVISFPFVLLPTVIVPLVLIGNMAAFILLLKSNVKR